MVSTDRVPPAIIGQYNHFYPTYNGSFIDHGLKPDLLPTLASNNARERDRFELDSSHLNITPVLFLVLSSLLM